MHNLFFTLLFTLNTALYDDDQFLVDFDRVDFKISKEDRIVIHQSMITEFENVYSSCKVEHLKAVHQWVVNCQKLDNPMVVENYLKNNLTNVVEVFYEDDEGIENEGVIDLGNEYEDTEEKRRLRFGRNGRELQRNINLGQGTCAELKTMEFDDFTQLEYFPRRNLFRKRTDIHLLEAWKEYCEEVEINGGHLVKVAIDDSGLDTSHIGLKNHVVRGKFNTTTDTRGHGTHVGGIVMMSPNLTDKIVGVNSYTDNNIKIVPRYSPWLRRSAFSEKAKAINDNIENGMRISNSSWGSKRGHLKFYESLFKKLEQHNHLFVTGAGNENLDLDKEKFFPCKQQSPVVLCVGSIDRFSRRSRFSNYGKHHVDIFAPGEDINSTLPGNRYARRQGTSMASPIVAGVAAMILSLRPNLSSGELKEILMNSVDKDNRLTNVSVSGGRLNAYKAVMNVRGKSSSPPENKDGNTRNRNINGNDDRSDDDGDRNVNRNDDRNDDDGDRNVNRNDDRSDDDGDRNRNRNDNDGKNRGEKNNNDNDWVRNNDGKWVRNNNDVQMSKCPVIRDKYFNETIKVWSECEIRAGGKVMDGDLFRDSSNQYFKMQDGNWVFKFDPTSFSPNSIQDLIGGDSNIMRLTDDDGLVEFYSSSFFSKPSIVLLLLFIS